MTPRGSSLVRLASRCARASAVAALVGIGFLVGMFAAFATGAQSTGQTLGLINDTLVLAQFALVIPVVLALAAVTPVRSRVVAVLVPLLGLAGVAWVVYWQAVLVAGVVTFEEQIGPASAGFLVLAIWFVASGALASRAGLVRRGGWVGLLAATYVGFPVWAWWIGGRLATKTGPEAATTSRVLGSIPERS